MDTDFKSKVEDLYNRSYKIFDRAELFNARRSGSEYHVDIPKDYEEDFFAVVERVTLNLMQDKDNFYGYFLFQMDRKIRFDIDSPSGINFKNAKFVLYINPVLFLQLGMNEMKSTIKHEILHVLSLHLIRIKELKGKVSTLALNLAMDITVNQYLDCLPPYAVTLSSVNLKYNLDMKQFNTLKYYAQNIQGELDLNDEDKNGSEDDSKHNEDTNYGFTPETSHNIWEESSDVDEGTVRDFTEKYIRSAEKGTLSVHVQSLVDKLRNSRPSIPWNIYLKKLLGTVLSGKKKTITIRNRRQPYRLELKGELRNHKAEIVVAIDISGSISNEEFKQAMREVLGIVKNYDHKISVIECDNDIRRVYSVKNERDIKDRKMQGGGTRFSPVFKYCNKNRIDLLIYFTDGKGEKKLDMMPTGYKVLWILSGRSEKLSLQKPYGAVKKLKKVAIVDSCVDLKDIKTDGYSMNNQEPIF